MEFPVIESPINDHYDFGSRQHRIINNVLMEIAKFCGMVPEPNNTFIEINDDARQHNDEIPESARNRTEKWVTVSDGIHHASHLRTAKTSLSFGEPHIMNQHIEWAYLHELATFRRIVTPYGISVDHIGYDPDAYREIWTTMHDSFL